MSVFLKKELVKWMRLFPRENGIGESHTGCHSHPTPGLCPRPGSLRVFA